MIFLPWSDPRSRFTALFEKLACEILLSCKNQTQAAGLLRVSWKQIHQIQFRAVEKALPLRKHEPLQYLGIDEKSFLKGHKYVAVRINLMLKMVLDVSQGRNEVATIKVLEWLRPEQKAGVSAVTMDMWEPYKKVIEKQCPNAAIVHDRFHITGYLTKAIDSVR